MTLFPRFAAGEFAPLFRLMDDYASHQFSRSSLPSFQPTTLRSFQPRFDVKEGKDSYHLEGELPGIDQENVNIEFSDPQTLTIRGRSERLHESGARPSQSVKAMSDRARPTQETIDTDSYHKATVEDEAATSVSGVNPEVSTEQVAATKDTEAPATQAQPQQKFWLSERSVGEFQRTFNFPDRVDQDNVKASLKNGILSILVPKAQAPASRKIHIQ